MLAPPTRALRTGVVNILPLAVMTTRPVQSTHAMRPMDVPTLPRYAMTTMMTPSTLAIRRLGYVYLLLHSFNQRCIHEEPPDGWTAGLDGHNCKLKTSPP
jgi:hypothetical protein